MSILRYRLFNKTVATSLVSYIYVHNPARLSLVTFVQRLIILVSWWSLCWSCIKMFTDCKYTDMQRAKWIVPLYFLLFQWIFHTISFFHSTYCFRYIYLIQDTKKTILKSFGDFIDSWMYSTEILLLLRKQRIASMEILYV